MTTPRIDSTYGAIFIGLLFATFFQGILSVQAYIYYERFPEDSWKIKLMVAGVWCIDLFHLVLIAHPTYHLLVSNWGDVSALAHTPWTLGLHVVVVGIATIVCQFFFLYRIYIFSNRNKPLVVSLAVICVAMFGLSMSITINDTHIATVKEVRSSKATAIATFTMSAGSDMIIALVLCYYFYRSRSGTAKIKSLIARLILYTMSTSLLTGLLAIACLIAYFASPDTFIFVALNLSLGRMYTNSLLATLNSRTHFRKTLDGPTQNKDRASTEIGQFQVATKKETDMESQTPPNVVYSSGGSQTSASILQ